MSAQRSVSLYQLSSEYQSLIPQLYDYETGEINMEVQAQIDALSDTAENKCIAIASWIKKMESDKQQIVFMKEEILKREAAYDKEINKRLDYLKTNMEGCGITEVKCAYFTLRIKKNPYSTDISDASKIPEQFIRTKKIVKTEKTPDKNAIKEEFVKTGVQVPGAFVQKKTKLEILTDKI